MTAVKRPKISILILTYNRASLVERAVQSVLNQTYTDYELILVNNGSTDHTKEVLAKYKGHDQIRIFHLEKNRQCHGGHNYGFDQMRGEWFGAIGDDDVLMEHAFATMMKVLDEVDPTLTAITSNALDSSTGKFSGQGLDRNQYLPLEKIVSATSGEFFALNKLSLLGELRFNEKLLGESNSLWYQIDAKAHRYYLHQALKVWSTDTPDSETSKYQQLNLEARANLFQELLKEERYWEVLKKYDPYRYAGMALRGFFFSKVKGRKNQRNTYQEKLQDQSLSTKHQLFHQFVQLVPATLLLLICQLSQHGFLQKQIAKFKTNRLTSRQQADQVFQ